MGWKCKYISMVLFFAYIVYNLLIGFSSATNAESDPAIRREIVSWKCYHIFIVFFVYIVHKRLICFSCVLFVFYAFY